MDGDGVSLVPIDHGRIQMYKLHWEIIQLQFTMHWFAIRHRFIITISVLQEEVGNVKLATRETSCNWIYFRTAIYFLEAKSNLTVRVIWGGRWHKVTTASQLEKGKIFFFNYNTVLLLVLLLLLWLFRICTVSQLNSILRTPLTICNSLIRPIKSSFVVSHTVPVGAKVV